MVIKAVNSETFQQISDVLPTVHKILHELRPGFIAVEGMLLVLNELSIWRINKREQRLRSNYKGSATFPVEIFECYPIGNREPQKVVEKRNNNL